MPALFPHWQTQQALAGALIMPGRGEAGPGERQATIARWSFLTTSCLHPRDHAQKNSQGRATTTGRQDSGCVIYLKDKRVLSDTHTPCDFSLSVYRNRWLGESGP